MHMGTAGKGRLITEAMNMITKLDHRKKVVVLVGEPYSGKTTVLRAIVEQEKKKYERRVVLLSSSPQLDPDLTVYENTLCPLLIDEVSKSAIRKRASRVLKALDLDKVSNRYPHELTPDQQVRASLARALISEPDIVLIDEVPLRASSWRVLRSLQRKMGFTIVWTTHDMRKALKVGDRVLTIKRDRIELFRVEELN